VADPLFLPAHPGLGELYLQTANAGGVAAQGAALRELGAEGAAEAAVLDARWLLARKDYAGEAAVLEAAAREFPHSVGVRVALSHVRLAEGTPPEVLSGFQECPGVGPGQRAGPAQHGGAHAQHRKVGGGGDRPARAGRTSVTCDT
jgi:hypothetical protein